MHKLVFILNLIATTVLAGLLILMGYDYMTVGRGLHPLIVIVAMPPLAAYAWVTCAFWREWSIPVEDHEFDLTDEIMSLHKR